MKLREFSLLTDENLDPEVVAGLRELGLYVVDVVGGRKREHATLQKAMRFLATPEGAVA